MVFPKPKKLPTLTFGGMETPFLIARGSVQLGGPDCFRATCIQHLPIDSS